jgi:asparagine synthase (glutamine-hydrolysing)
VEQLLSEESLRKTGYFEPAAVQHWRRAFRTLRPGSPHRASVEMGLVGVVATQLWHHTFIDASLADLPSVAAERGSRSGERAAVRPPRLALSAQRSPVSPGRGN